MTDSSKMTEVREIHTRLCRVSLAVEDAHVYWFHARPGTSAPELAEQAFEAFGEGPQQGEDAGHAFAAEPAFLTYPPALVRARNVL